MATKEAFQEFLRNHTDDELLIDRLSADCPRKDSLHLDMALKYLDLDWSIIPIRPKNKGALIPWKKYQQRAPTREEVIGWWRENPQAGIAVVLGKNSGIICVDIDGENGELTLKGVGIDLGQSQTVRPQRSCCIGTMPPGGFRR